MAQLTKQVQRQEREERRQERKVREKKKAEEKAERKARGEDVSSAEEELDADESETEYSSEDETGNKLMDSKTDMKIFETLNMIRKKDPRIYQKDVAFFEDKEAEEDEEEDKPKKEKKKKLTIGRFMASVNPDELDSEGSDMEDKQPTSGFFEEQERLKREFFESLRKDEEEKRKLKAKSAPKEEESEEESDESEDDLFTKSTVVYDPNLDEDDKDAKKQVKKDEIIADVESAKNVVKEIKKKDKAGKAANILKVSAIEDDMTAQAKFLQEYVMNEWWKETDTSKLPSADAILGKARGDAIRDEGFDIDADDDFNDAADRYEAELNFRFEEDGANEVVSYPRVVEDSMRRKNDKRKQQRMRKAERKRLEKERKLEEIKRLKNVTKKALKDKLQAIAMLAGVDADTDDENGDGIGKLTARDLAEDFDPKEYDKRMREIFNDKFYDGEDEMVQEDEDEDEEEAEKKKRLELKTKSVEYLKKRQEEDEEEADRFVKEAESKAEELRKKKLMAIAKSHQRVEEEDDSEAEEDDDELDAKEAEKAAKTQAIVAGAVKKRSKESRKKVMNQIEGIFETETTPESEAKKWLEAEKQRILNTEEVVERLKGLKGAARDQEIRKIMSEEMEKLYDLDKEDVVLGSKYQYMEVPAADYGLSLEDILNMDDKELNSRVSMKKLAPYREDIDDNRHWSDIVKEQKKVFKEYQLKKAGPAVPKSVVPSRATRDLKPSNTWSDTVVSVAKPKAVKVDAKSVVKGKKTGWIASAEDAPVNKKRKFGDDDSQSAKKSKTE